MSIFDGIEHKTGAVGRSTDITPGVYEFEALSVADGVTPFTKDDFFKVGVKVLASSGEPCPSKDGSLVNPLPVGTETEIFIGRDKYGYFITEIKELAAVLSNATAALVGESADFTPASITEADLKTLVAPEQPAKGVRFRGVYSVKPGKFNKNGTPVSNKKYAAILGASAGAAAGTSATAS